MDHENPTPASAAIGFSVRVEDLSLLVKVGDTVIAAALTPQGALELARDLLAAGLDHAAARAEQRLQAEQLAEDVVRKASH